MVKVNALLRAKYALLRGGHGRSWCYAAILLLAACLLPVAGGAAPAMAKPFRIGALTASWGPPPAVVGLRDGLVALGYRENRDFVIGTRFTSGDASTLPAAARELVALGVDVIITNENSSALAARRATSSIPIVFTLVDNPVKIGLVRSYARPGGNITGVADDNTLLAPKRLEIFKQLVPRLNKVLFVYDGGDVSSVAQAKAYRAAGGRLGIVLVEQAVRTEAQAKVALAGAGRDGVDGIVAPIDPLLNIPGLVLEATAKKGMPTMFPVQFMVESGGLASYAPNDFSSGRQAARLVDKIMRGVKPADIPVEVNNDIEFAINLKVAKALGLKIDPQVLYRADRIVR